MPLKSKMKLDKLMITKTRKPVKVFCEFKAKISQSNNKTN